MLTLRLFNKHFWIGKVIKRPIILRIPPVIQIVIHILLVCLLVIFSTDLRKEGEYLSDAIFGPLTLLIGLVQPLVCVINVLPELSVVFLYFS